MNGSNHKPHVTETPDVSHIKNVQVGHEVRDVQVGGVTKFVVALGVLTIGVYFLMWGLFNAFQRSEVEPPASPMVQHEGDRLPPEPRLQGAPGFAAELGKTAGEKQEPGESQSAGARIENPKDSLWEIRALRKQWEDVLKNGPVDQNGKRFGMPIEQAERQLVQEGLPVRKPEASKQEAVSSKQ
jgi:hypothetical protein